MAKQYHIRVYIPTEEIGLIMNDAVNTNAFKLNNSFDGMNGMIAIYDGYCNGKVLKFLISLGITYFPLDNYEDFIITCPNCGERINDDMILTIYDENLLSGYNILCYRNDCGTQMADVEFLNQQDMKKKKIFLSKYTKMDCLILGFFVGLVCGCLLGLI